jgi:hypothetical protein
MQDGSTEESITKTRNAPEELKPLPGSFRGLWDLPAPMLICILC